LRVDRITRKSVNVRRFFSQFCLTSSLINTVLSPTPALQMNRARQIESDRKWGLWVHSIITICKNLMKRPSQLRIYRTN